MKPMMAAIGVILCLSAAMFLWSQRQGGPKLSTSSGGTPERLPAHEESGEQSPPPTEPSAATGATRDLDTHPDGPAPTDTAWVTVKGRVTAIDAQLQLHGNEDGTLRLSVEGQPPVTHQVEGGRFSFRAPSSFSCEIADLVLGSRSVHPIQALFTASDLSDQGLLEVYGRWARTGVLRAVDALTGRDLRHVTVYARPHPVLSGLDHPGAEPDPALRLAESNASPVEFTDVAQSVASDPLELLVGARGYAWTRVSFDFDDAQQRVELGPGGTLEVRLSGPMPSTTAAPEGEDPQTFASEQTPRLRLRPAPLADWPTEEEYLARIAAAPEESFPNGRRYTEEEARTSYRKFRELALSNRSPATIEDTPRVDRATVWEGVAPGKYLLSVELGGRNHSPRIVGETDVVVEAGRTTRADLTLTPLPDVPDDVLVAGTLFIPPTWGEVSRQLQCEPMELLGGAHASTHTISTLQVQPDPELPSTYRWSLGTVPPGTWRITLTALEHRFWVDIEPLGNESVALRLPPPADVEVRVIDERNGANVPGQSVHWRPFIDDLKFVQSARDLTWDDAAQLYRFRAPAGAVMLGLHPETFHIVDLQERYDVRPGINHIDLSVRRLFGIRFLSSNDGASSLVPFEWFRSVRVAAIESQATGYLLSSSILGDEREVFFPCTEAGRYLIEFPERPGYHPLEPVEVDVQESGYTDVPLTFTRR